MINKKAKHVEVIVAATKPEIWDAIRKKGTATQKENAPDADYIAFFQVGQKDERSAITHIAEVKRINHRALISEHFKRNPEILELSKREKKGWEYGTYHTEYNLKEIKKLSMPIMERKRRGTRCQVRLHTTLEQIKKAKYLSDIKTVSQLKKNAKRN